MYVCTGIPHTYEIRTYVLGNELIPGAQITVKESDLRSNAFDSFVRA